MSFVQAEYKRLVDAMTPAERMERGANLLAWSRQVTGRMIVKEMGEMSPERLKWHIALRHYGQDPVMRRLIEEAMSHVPG